MFESWAIGVVIRATSNVPQVMTAAAGSVGTLNTRLSLANKRMKMLELQAAQLRGIATLLGGISLAGGAVIAYSLDQASKLQLAMTTVQMVTHSTADEMERLEQIVLRTSMQTAQSIPTTAAEMLNWARVTGFVGQKLQSTFPIAARFGDVMQFMGKALGRKIDPVEAISIGAQFGHYLQAYQPRQLMAMGPGAPKGLLDWMFATMAVQGEDMRRLLLQGKYFAPLATIAGTSPRDIMTLLALMGRTGFLRGRGGTAVENAIIALAEAQSGIGPLGKGSKLQMMRQLGMLDPRIMAGGHFNLDPFIADLAKALHGQGSSRFIAMMSTSFGKQAGQFLTAMASPAIAGHGGQIDQIKSSMDKVPTVLQAFNQYNQTFALQLQRFFTNIQSIGAILGKAMLPVATKWLTKFNDALEKLAEWMMMHPDATKKIAGGIVGATAIAFGGFVFSMVRLLGVLRAINAIKWAGALAKAGIKGGGIFGAGGMMDALGLGFIIKPLAVFFDFLKVIGTRIGLLGLARGGAVGLALRILGEGLFKLVPIIGWVSLIWSGFEAINFIFHHLADIMNWWGANKDRIIYIVSFGFFKLVDLIIQGLKGMFMMVASFVSTIAGAIVHHPMDVLQAQFGNFHPLMGDIGTAFGGTVNQYAPANASGDISRAFQAAFGIGGHTFRGNMPGQNQPIHVVHISGPVHIQANSPGQLLDQLLKQGHTAMNTTPTYGAETPYYSFGSIAPVSGRPHHG
jgi:TP901 family phage tail tape measure protein